MLAGQQLAVEAAVDLVDPYTDYMVAAVGEVRYSQVGMAQVDHYYTARESLPVMAPELHQAGDRTEDRERKMFSLRNWKGRALAFR